MTLIRISVVLTVALLASITSAHLAWGIGDREAVKQLARWSRGPADAGGMGQRPPPAVAAGEYRRWATTRATRNAWAVWATAVPLGLGLGLLMGRGGLHFGTRDDVHGEAGCLFTLVSVLVIALVLGVARLVARVAGRAAGACYAAAVAGVVAGLVLTIPATLVLTLFTPVDSLDEIEAGIALRVALLCGTTTIAALAATIAPMITPAARHGGGAAAPAA